MWETFEPRPSLSPVLSYKDTTHSKFTLSYWCPTSFTYSYVPLIQSRHPGKVWASYKAKCALVLVKQRHLKSCTILLISLYHSFKGWGRAIEWRQSFTLDKNVQSFDCPWYYTWSIAHQQIGPETGTRMKISCANVGCLQVCSLVVANLFWCLVLLCIWRRDLKYMPSRIWTESFKSSPNLYIFARWL